MALYINDSGEYYNGNSLIYDGRLYLSPSEDIIIAAGYHEVIVPDPTDEELLANAKRDKLDDIEGYDSSDAVNSFTLNGVKLWLDAQTRQQLRISIDAYKAMNMQTVTKWFKGVEYTFPVALWEQMLNALEVYASEALNVTERHKSTVAALQTIAEVEAYDITTGYPQQLIFTSN